MKKRVISALLALCMACSLAGTAWAEDTAPDATAGAPAPAAQTQSLEEKQEPAESKAASDSASSESTVTSDSASSESTAPSDSASSESTVTSDSASSESTVTSDSTSGESTVTSDSASSESTVTSDSTSSESTVTSDSTSSESTVTSDSASSESTVTSDSASSSVQAAKPNQAPAASAPEAANDAPATLAAEPRATSNSFHITWSNYFDVTVYYVDQNGSSIEHDFACQDQTLTNGNSLTFGDFAQQTFDTDTGTYTYEGAHYGSYNGGNVTSVRASQQTDDYLFGGSYNTYYYNFAGAGNHQLSYTEYRWSPTDSTQTASIYLVYNYEEFQPEELPEDDAISIVETVARDGMFTAVYNGTLNEGDTVTYTWEYSLNGVADTWKPVESQKVTGENFNWRPDVDPQKINVAYDALLRSVENDQRYYYRVTATVERADGTTERHQAQLQVPYYIQLQNGSFENPDIPNNQFNEQWPNGQPGLIWQTTGPGSINGRDGDDIEVILENRNGTQENYGVNVAADGEQFAELNCEAYGALYQDVLTVPGTTLNWSFDHLARQLDSQSRRAEDKMAMVIMPADQADAVAQDLQNAARTYRNNPQQASQAIQEILNELKNQPGCYVYEATDSTYVEEGDWQTHESTTETAYTVPNDQYLTRFFFVSVDAAYDKRSDAVRSKYGTVGNLIDDVWFSTKVPEPDDDEAQLTVRKTVEGLDDLSGYSVTMTVQPEGEQAQTITLNQFAPNADGTYTATKTINYKVAANDGYKKVTVSETQPTVQNYSVESKYTVTGAAQQEDTGTQTQQFTIPARQNATVTFTNTYTPTTTDVTVTKTFVGLTQDQANQVWDNIHFSVVSGDMAIVPPIEKDEDVTVKGDSITATATITELDIGKDYTITETNADLENYTRTTTATVNGTGSAEAATITGLKAGDTVAFTNNYTPTTGSLTIKKKVDGLTGSANANNTEFKFTITGPGTMFKEGETSKTFDAVDAAGTPVADVTFSKDGDAATATVTITGEGSLKINGLPLGPYTVQETSAPDIGDFYCDLPDEPVSKTISNATKTELDQTATITNTYKPYKTLTIEKTVTGEMGTATDEFDFAVAKTNGTLTAGDVTVVPNTGVDESSIKFADSKITFKLKNGGQVTLGHLKDTDVVTITETDPGNGYKLKAVVTPLIKNDEDEPVFTANPKNVVTATLTNLPQDASDDLGTVTFTNERKAVAPTGLESDHNAPFALMVGAAFLAGAALLGNVVLRRRRRWQE